MLTLSQHDLSNGKKAVLAVQRLDDAYTYLVSLDYADGKPEQLYRVVDCLERGYTVQKVGADTTYRVYVGDRGASCSCPDARYRGRQCKHTAICREVARLW